jgi:preprotein translocase subunit SecE
MSQYENAPNKPVHLVYLCGGLLLFFLLQWTMDWLFGVLGLKVAESTMTIVAAVAALSLTMFGYRNDRLYVRVNDIMNELKKVTWPTMTEVRTNTIVVIVMSIIAAAILFIFDFTWSKLTDLVYGG